MDNKDPERTIIKRIRRGLYNNSPFIVGISFMIVIHWAWLRLQHNEMFVSEEDRLLHPSPFEKRGFPTMFRTLKENVFPPKPKDPEKDSE